MQTEFQARDFFKHLYKYCEEGFINLRFLPSAKNFFISLIKLESIKGVIESHNGQNAFFGVATRSEGKGTKTGILQIPALWVDLDLEGLSEEKMNEIRRLYKDFPLKPTVVINSGGGYHIYWLLKESASKEETPLVERTLKRLALYFHGDMAATDASRILRVPGSWNRKYSPVRQVTLKAFHPEREYSLNDFDFLPEVDVREEKPRPSEEWWKEFLGGVAEGERNSCLTRLAGRYLEKELSREEILPLLLEVNSKNKPPLPEREVEEVLDSVIKTYERNRPKDEGIVLVKGRNYIKRNDEVCWIVEKLIPEGAIILLHGKGGVGKTQLVLQIAKAVSEGGEFMELMAKKCPVVYINYDNPCAVLKERLKQTQALEIFICDNGPKLDEKDFEKINALPEGALIIIDAARAGFRGDENSSRDVSDIVEKLKGLRNKGFTIFLIHHTPKGNEKIFRGSGAFSDQADHVLSLHSVRRAGDSYEEFEGDRYDAPDLVFFFGVREKTRYEAFHLFLKRLPEKRWALALDPVEEQSKELQSILFDLKAELGRLPIQKEILEKAAELGWKYHGTFGLLKRGEGKYWNSISLKDRKNARVYDPVFQSFNTNIDEKLKNTPPSFSARDEGNKPKVLINNEFFSFSEDSRKTENQPPDNLSLEKVPSADIYDALDIPLNNFMPEERAVWEEEVKFWVGEGFGIKEAEGWAVDSLNKNEGLKKLLSPKEMEFWEESALLIQDREKLSREEAARKALAVTLFQRNLGD